MYKIEIKLLLKQARPPKNKKESSFSRRLKGPPVKAIIAEAVAAASVASGFHTHYPSLSLSLSSNKW